MPQRLHPGGAASFDTLTNQTLASQAYSTAILLPCALGWMGQILLTGFVLTSFVEYLRTEMYERDSRARKALLYTVVAMTAVQAGLNFFSISYWMVKQDRDAASLLHPTVPDAIQPLSIAFNGPLVQGFLAHRATRLVTLRWVKYLARVLFGTLIVLEFGAIIFSTVLGILFHMNKLSGALLQSATYGLISGIWLVLAAAIDISISVLLVVVLRRRIAGFNASTDGRLRALSHLAVQSASYTAFVALGAVLFTYCSPSNNLMWSCAPYAFWWLLSACYALALLTTLSSRSLIRHTIPSGLPGPSLPTIAKYAPAPLGGLTHSGARANSPTTMLNSSAEAESAAKRSPPMRYGDMRGVAAVCASEGGTGSGIQVAHEVLVRVETHDDPTDPPARARAAQRRNRDDRSIEGPAL